MKIEEIESKDIIESLQNSPVPRGIEGRCASCKYCDDPCGDGCLCTNKKRLSKMPPGSNSWFSIRYDGQFCDYYEYDE